jgi:hypothetical protein
VGRFGEASDVRAFGVRALELLTLGYIPYAKITDLVCDWGGEAVEGKGNLRVP